jgi:hypothetical protein
MSRWSWSDRNKEPKDYWSEDEQIFFHYGKGYGVTDNLTNICLGNEDDIKKFLETGELNGNLNASQGKVLIEIQEYRKEEGIGAGKRDMVRAGINGTAGHQPKATRQSTPRTRLARRASKQKSKSLLRR